MPEMAKAMVPMISMITKNDISNLFTYFLAHYALVACAVAYTMSRV
jgi:hypothetical protein